MKWYFALSEQSLSIADQGWENLIRVAVRSARLRTTLEPHFLYDGPASPFTEELSRMGVKVVRHRVTFLDLIAAGRASAGLPDDPIYLAIAAGAFLRTEIPLIEQEDEFVVYTDCDVMFLNDPALDQYRPEYFACAPQRRIADPLDMNSGVMVMNVPALRRNLPDFSHYIVHNFTNFDGFDQPAFRRYYAGRYEQLPPELNWKPYWGSNPDASIVHFHGPKPDVVRKLMESPEYATAPILHELFTENTVGYSEFLDQWEKFQAAA